MCVYVCVRACVCMCVRVHACASISLVRHDKGETESPFCVFDILQSAQTGIVDHQCGVILGEQEGGEEGVRRGRGRRESEEG